MSKPFGYVTKTGQFITKSALDKYAIKTGEESNQLIDDPFSGKYGSLSLREPIYNPLKLALLMELNTYHESCVYTKAHDVAGSGFELIRGEKATDEEMKLLEDFFHSSYFSTTKTFNASEVDYHSMGYSTIEVVKENKAFDGKPLRLTQIPSHTMRLHNNRQMFVQQVGTKAVYYKAISGGNSIIDDSKREMDLDKTTGDWVEAGSVPFEKRATEILYFHRYHPRDLFYGIPQIVPGITTITGDISRAKYNTTFFDNYAVPSYAVFITGPFKDKDILDSEGNVTGTELQKSIETHFKELAKNPHSTLILTLPSDDKEEGEVKVDFKPLSVDVKEASFRLYRKDNRDEIVSKHKMPPYRIGIYETGSLGGNLGIESTKIYRDSEVKPNQEKYYAAINDYLIKTCFEIEDIKFKFNDLSIDENTQNITDVSNLMNIGVMTPNQAIRVFATKYNLEESKHPAMDAHYINGYPIDLEYKKEEPVPDVVKILTSLKHDLLKEVEKDVSTESGRSNRGIVKAIKRRLPSSN